MTEAAADAKHAVDVKVSSFKPQLLVQAPKVADAVQFYKVAFDAKEVRIVCAKRKGQQDLSPFSSADLKLGALVFSVAGRPYDATQASKGGSVWFCLETEDLDGVIAKAVRAGAMVEGDVTDDKVSGRRVGKVKDPYGFTWVISAVAVKLSCKPQLLFQVPKTADAVQFYKVVFCAEEVGRVVHEQDPALIQSTDLKLGPLVFSVADCPAAPVYIWSDTDVDPDGAIGWAGDVVFCLETEDVYSVLGNAIAARAMTGGDLQGKSVAYVKDPFCFTWIISAAQKPDEED